MSTTKSTYRIAAVQMDPILGDLDANRAKILKFFAEAVADGADLVVFPECALTGYCFADKAEAMPCAIEVPGPGLDWLVDACRASGKYAVIGLLERDGDRLFNSCVLVGPSGFLADYRKIHLPYLGVDRFTDFGDLPFAVHDAGGLKIGMHICYDGAFPESARLLSLLGADLIVLPTNWPNGTERIAELLVASRGLENTVYSLACNRVGEERGFGFIGRSSICGTRGEILAFAGPDAEEIVYADIDPEMARDKRQVRVPGQSVVDRIHDRRPALYGPLVEPVDGESTREISDVNYRSRGNPA